MEEAFKDLWQLFGREMAEFGLRWAVVGVAVLGFGGFFGRRYRSMRRDNRSMQERLQTLEEKVKDQNQALEMLRYSPPSSPVTINMPKAGPMEEQRVASPVERPALPSAPTPETWISREEAEAIVRQSSLVRIPVESTPVPQGQTIGDELFAALAGRRTSRETKADELTRNLMFDFATEYSQGVSDGRYGQELLEWWIAKRSAAQGEGWYEAPRE